MDYKIDWLTLTMKPVKDNQYMLMPSEYDNTMCPLEYWCFQFLGLHREISQFKKRQGSIQHYNVMYTYNGISIALSVPERFAEQGLMLRFSGDGISFYEKFRKKSDNNWTWVSFLKEFFSLASFGFTCKCTRIDLAFDDISTDGSRLIDLKTVEKALKKGEFVSNFRTTDNRIPYRLIPAYEEIKRNTKGDILGETLYVGNRKSKVFLRFYDKLLECKATKTPYDEKIKHWVRMEFEFKDVRAMTICDSLITLTDEEFSTYMSQVTNRYIRFVVPKGTRDHYSRCASKKWWINIVKTIAKSRLVENKAYKNKFNSSMRWLRRQVFPTIYAILHCIKVDDFIADVRDTGKAKLKHSTENQIIDDYLKDTQSESFSGIEIHKASSDEYEKIIHELEVCAFGTKMRRLGRSLCEAANLMDEYDKYHKSYINSSYNKNILEFKTREQIDNEPYPFDLRSVSKCTGQEQPTLFTYGYMEELDELLQYF